MLDRQKVIDHWFKILELLAVEEEKDIPMMGERRELLKLIDNSIKFPAKFEQSCIKYITRQNI